MIMKNNHASHTSGVDGWGALKVPALSEELLEKRELAFENGTAGRFTRLQWQPHNCTHMGSASCTL